MLIIKKVLISFTENISKFV